MHVSELADLSLERHGVFERIADARERLTNAELIERARDLAAGMRASGVQRGDRVAVMLGNSAQVGVVYEGIWRAGAAVVPLMPSLSEAEVAHILGSADPAMVIAGGAAVGRCAAALGSSRGRPALVGLDDEAGADLAYADLGSAGGELPAGQLSGSDLAAVLFTGGTTGRAKGVMLTHDNLTANAQAAAEVCAYADGDVTLVSLPLSHSYGLSVLVIALHVRARLFVLPRFDPAGFATAARGERATTSDVVPAMLQRLLDEAVDPAELAGLRALFAGGAPCPPELIERFERELRVPVLNGYGLTEAGPLVTAYGPRHRRDPASVGPPIPDVQLRIADRDGRALPAGEAGQILVRSPGVMAGYWRDPEATAAATAGGWLHTGDLGVLDADGHLTIVGRAKDVIIRNGFNVYPLDVEEALRGLPGVEDALVVGAADERRGERVVAAVLGDVTSDGVIALCREHLSAHKRPDEVVVLHDLPRTPLGKPDRRALSQRLERNS